MRDLKQKFISFTECESEIQEISQDIKNGWAIVKLIPDKGHFIGLLEKTSSFSDQEDSIYIPSPKRIIVN